MAHLLIVDDEQMIRKGLREYAEFEGHTVVEAENGMVAVNICKEQDFDMIIMDVMMPKLDGFSACKEIRKTKNIPVLMLSARGEEYDKLFGFEVGIDDYVIKPFSPKEVMARVNVIVGRNKNKAKEQGDSSEIISFGRLEVDFTARNVMIDKIKVDLTLKELDLLFYFIENKNTVLSKEKILMDVWPPEFCGDERTVGTHISMLQHSLGGCKVCIVEVPGVGYKFEAS